MEQESLAKEIELVVCSPMRRTIQTMVNGLEDVLSRDGVKVEFDAIWQGGLCFFDLLYLIS
jgi:phosphohistidine phosphatase SixA